MGSSVARRSNDGASQPTVSQQHAQQPAWRPLKSYGLALSVLILAATLLRLALFSISWLPSTLETRLELNDPHTAWSSVRRVHWSLQRQDGVVADSLYLQGQADRPMPPPILMMILEHVLPTRGHESVVDADSRRRRSRNSLQDQLLDRFLTTGIDSSAILYTMLDALSIFLVFQIAAKRLQTPLVPTKTSKSKSQPAKIEARRLLQSLRVSGLWLDPNPLHVAALYAFNPLTILTCVARSGTTIIATATLLSIAGAMAGFAGITGLAIALSSSLSLHTVWYSPAVLALCCRQQRYYRHHATQRRIGKRLTDTSKDWSTPLLWTGIFLAGFLWLSAGFIAEKQGRGDIDLKDLAALAQIYKSFLTLPSLRPSLSLWWYFFIEIFEHFRSFFLLVFNAHLAAWTVPVTIRYRHDPLFATFLLIGVRAIFGPYPTAGDVAAWWTLSALFGTEYRSYLRNPLPPVLLYLYASLLIPSFSHLFLVLGSANANFLYAVGLIWSLGGVGMWLDWAWAGGRLRYEREREAGIVASVDDDGDRDAKAAGTSSASKTKSRQGRRAVVQV